MVTIRREWGPHPAGTPFKAFSWYPKVWQKSKRVTQPPLGIQIPVAAIRVEPLPMFREPVNLAMAKSNRPAGEVKAARRITKHRFREACDQTHTKHEL